MSEIKCTYCNNEPHFVFPILTEDCLVKQAPNIKCCLPFFEYSCTVCGIKTHPNSDALDKIREMTNALGAKRKKILTEKGLPLL